jgi:Mg/Co/Ni transporter MgtE
VALDRSSFETLIGHVVRKRIDGLLPLAVTGAVTLLVLCAWLTTIGAVIPMATRRFGLDPAVLLAA